MKIFRTAVKVDGDKLMFWDVDEVECPKEFFEKFKWDKIVRIDSMVDLSTYFFSTERNTLDALWVGWHFNKQCGTPEQMKSYLSTFKDDANDRLGTPE